MYDLHSLPEYHLDNGISVSSRLYRVPKVVSPLSDRFGSEESELGDGKKDWSMTVELRPDGRHVELKTKVSDSEEAVPQDLRRVDPQLCVSLSAAIKRHAELLRMTKSALRQMSCSKPLKELQPEQVNETDVEALFSSAMKPCSHLGTAAEQQLASGADGRLARRKPCGGLKETWRLLDTALYQKGRSRRDNDGMMKRLVDEKGRFVRKQIPVEPVEKMMDPRLPLVDSETRQELDLPVPVFGLLITADESEKPIDVIIGMRGVVADSAAEGVEGNDDSTQQYLLESTYQRLLLLAGMAGDEFPDAISSIQAFIDARVAKYEAQLASSKQCI